MKTLNKIVSLVMVVIMLITAIPVLQAADFTAEIDKAELNSLRKEIQYSFQNQFNFKKDGAIYEGIPSVKTLQKRYEEALDNYYKNFQEFSNSDTKPGVQEAQQYIEYKKREAKILAKEDKRFQGFASEEEKEEIAFYTLLFRDMKEADEAKELRKKWKEFYLDNVAMGFVNGIWAGFVAWAIKEGVKNIPPKRMIPWMLGGAGVGTILALVLSTDKRFPVFSSELAPEAVKYQFLDNPFRKLSLFNTGGVDDFAVFYFKGKDFAQILYDAVDIEWYISQNPNMGNMIYRGYPRTLEWQNLTTEQKAAYLHEYAERLRAEVK